MLNRLLIIIGIIGILAGAYVWHQDGHQIFSKDREEVVKEVKDELFGTVTRTTEYVPSFKFGLLPLNSTIADIPRCYAFVLGACGTLIALGVVRMRKSS
ncbi:MAG: hypothetical protein ACKOE4_03325 [Candidatus Kapaibacterium sp.]